MKAWSISSKGEEYELKEKEAVETSLFNESLYQDDRNKVLKIPAEVGSVVGYEYEQKQRPLFFHGAWNFQNSVPTQHSHYTLRLPASWEHEAFFVNHAKVEPREEGPNQWSWSLDDIAPLEIISDLHLAQPRQVARMQFAHLPPHWRRR